MPKILNRVLPTAEELHALVWAKPSSEVAKQFDVCDKTIGLWCQQLGVEKPPRGYWGGRTY